MNVDSLSKNGKADVVAMTKDILKGDVDLLNDKRFSGFDAKAMKAALELLKLNDPNGDYAKDITDNGWRLMYYRKPPTPEEFLTYEWIGPQAETLWPNLRKAFIEFMDPSPLCSYRNLALSVSIGWGKDQPVSSNIAVEKVIELELEDGKILKVPSNEEIEVLEKGRYVKVKSVKYSYTYKKLKDFSIGDSVLTPDGGHAKVADIRKNGIRDVYKITLSDGRYFRTSETHASTVCFRTSYTRPGKKVYDTVTTKYIKDHLHSYMFEIPTDESFSIKELDFIQHIEALPIHDYEPAEEDHIIPITERDPSKVYIESIEKVGEEECWCLCLNDPMGLYITEDGIITHNSLLTVLVLTYITVLFGMMRKPYRLLNHSQPLYEKVLLPNGTYTTIGDLKVGMKIAGVTQTESEVLDIIDQGIKETVELTLENDLKVRCSMDHLWTVWNTQKNAYEVHSTKVVVQNPDSYLFPEEEDCIRDRDLILQAEQSVKGISEEELALL